MLVGRVERLDERVLRFDVLVTDSLVEPVRGSSRGARCQPDDEASPLPRPLFRRRHEHAGNPLPTVPLVDDETADEDERFRLEILRENRVNPSDDNAVDLGDEDALIDAREDPPNSLRGFRRAQVVAELIAEFGDLAGIGADSDSD